MEWAQKQDPRAWASALAQQQQLLDGRCRHWAHSYHHHHHHGAFSVPQPLLPRQDPRAWAWAQPGALMPPRSAPVSRSVAILSDVLFPFFECIGLLSSE